MKKATILLMFIFFGIHLYSQRIYDCQPESYEVKLVKHKPSDCTTYDANTKIYSAYRIRVGMYKNPITSYKNTVAFYWQGYYYYYYAGDVNDISPGYYTKQEAINKVNKLDKQGICTYKVIDPLGTVIFR